MAEVKVEFSSENAVLLLAAAEDLDLPAESVSYSPFEGHFVTDEKIAKKANVPYDHEKSDTEAEADEQAAKSRPTKRAPRTAKE